MNPLALIETYGADATRYGLMKMASSQDVRFSEGAIEEGRKLANKLWNVARLILQASEGATPDERPQNARGALDPRAAVADAARDRAAARRVRLLAPRRRALPPDVRRLLRLVRRGDQAAAVRRRRRRARDRASPRSSGCSSCCIRRCRTSPRRSGRRCPTRETRLIVAPWPEAGDDCDGRRARRAAGGGGDLPAQRRAADEARRGASSASSTPS